MAESGVDVICERSRNVLLLGLSDDDEANRLSFFVLTGHGIGTLRKNSVIVQPLSNVCVFCRTSAKTGIMSQSSLITSQSWPPFTLIMWKYFTSGLNFWYAVVVCCWRPVNPVPFVLRGSVSEIEESQWGNWLTHIHLVNGHRNGKGGILSFH